MIAGWASSSASSVPDELKELAHVLSCGSHGADVLLLVSFDRLRHVVGTFSLGLWNLTLSKKSSNRQWYCGLTNPVFGFKTKQTFLAFSFDGPR